MDITLNSRIAKDKLMILYIIKKSNQTLTYNQLSNFILEYEMLNYFVFVEYFNQLTESNFLEKWKGPEIKLTDFALQTLELLEETIDEDKKEKIDLAFSKDSVLEDNKQFQLVPLEDGDCIVKLSVPKDLDENFNLNFTVDSIDKGKKIEEGWLNKNKSLYREILNIIKEATSK